MPDTISNISTDLITDIANEWLTIEDLVRSRAAATYFIDGSIVENVVNSMKSFKPRTLGQLEWGIGKITNTDRLEELDLSELRNVGEEALINIINTFHNLTKLKLNGTAVTDTGLKDIAAIHHNLIELDIRGCNALTDDGVVAIVRANPKLKIFRLADTRVTDAGLKDIAAIHRNFIELDIRECNGLTDDGVVAIVRANPKLEIFRLPDTRVTDAGLENIAAIHHNLIELDISHLMAVRGRGIRAVAQSNPHLKRLYINRMSGEGLDRDAIEALGYCTELTTLELRTSLVKGSMVSGIDNITSLPNLTRLDISGAYWEAGDIAKIISKCRKLEVLDISGCNDDETVAKAIALNSKLHTLIMQGVAPISDNFISAIAETNHNFTTLNFRESDFEESADLESPYDSLSNLIRKNRHLEYLDLRGVPNINDAFIRAIIGTLPELRTLNISQTMATVSAVNDMLADIHESRIRNASKDINPAIDIIFPEDVELKGYSLIHWAAVNRPELVDELAAKGANIDEVMQVTYPNSITEKFTAKYLTERYGTAGAINVNADISLVLGSIFPEQELRLLTAAIAGGNGSAEIYKNRGLVYIQLQQYENAEADLASAIEKSDDSAVVSKKHLYAYGGMDRTNEQVIDGDYKIALARCTRAIERSDDNANVYGTRGAANLGLRNFAAARADCTIAIEGGYNSANVYGTRGTANLELRNYAAALVDCTIAIEGGYNSANMFAIRGTANLELRNYAAALADCTIAIKGGYNSANVYGTRGTANLGLGNYAAALADCTTAIEGGYNSANMFAIRGRVNVKLRDFAAALADYTRAKEKALSTNQTNVLNIVEQQIAKLNNVSTSSAATPAQAQAANNSSSNKASNQLVNDWKRKGPHNEQGNPASEVTQISDHINDSSLNRGYSK